MGNEWDLCAFLARLYHAAVKGEENFTTNMNKSLETFDILLPGYT